MQAGPSSIGPSERLQSVVDHLRVPAALLDAGGVIVGVNRAWAALRGNGVLAGPGFGPGVTYLSIAAVKRPDEPRLSAALADAVGAVLDGRADELTVGYVSVAGGIDDGGALMPAEGFVIRMTGIDADLGGGLLLVHRPQRPEVCTTEGEASTQRTIDLELANERLREEQRRQRGILDSIPDIAWLKDAGGRFLAVNKKFAESAGMDPEELVGKTDLQVWPRDLAERYRTDDQSVMQTRSMMRTEEPFVDQKGTRAFIETIKVPILNDDGQAIGTAGLARDVTERREAEQVLKRSNAELEALVEQRTEARKRAEEDRSRLEQELLQSQKLEGVGRLAGGIAHDFNNLLTIILAYGHQSLSKADLPNLARHYVTEMMSAAQRASDLTRQLLAFARKQPIEPRVIDLNELVLTTDGLLRPLLGADVELVTLPCADVASVKVDPGQFERILLNLAANARDAMPSGGKLVIATSRTVLDEAFAKHAELAAGDYVRLTVTDTGAGIAREVLPDIFDPFFTTKEVGGGTGLGLATCYGIVKQAGGHITVDSELGVGTRFEIYLPHVPLEEPRPRKTTAPPRSGGSETILLVEDEPLLRSITSEVLKEEGYRVLEAESGAEAIRVATEQPGRIDLLLTDVVMPHMSGKTAASRIGEIRPTVRVLFMSGYTGAMGGQPEKLDDGSAFLCKPFTREALLDRVRQLLDEGAGPSP